MPTMPKHRCTGSPTCPVMLPASTRYCPPHERAYQARRGSSTARGYDAAHEGLRRLWQQRINAGRVVKCWRCGRRLWPWRPGHDATPWDLGHVRRGSKRRLPECLPCNRGEGGARGAAARR